MAYKFLLMSELIKITGLDKKKISDDLKSKRLPHLKSGMYFLIEEKKLEKYLKKIKVV